MVFLLAGFQQYYWRARGGRNDAFSGVLLLGIAIGGIAILGWTALLSMLLGMVLGPVLARSPTPPFQVPKEIARSSDPAVPPSPIPQQEEPKGPTLTDRAKDGDPEAQYVVGYNLLNDSARREEGVEFLRKATLQGFRHAPYELGKALIADAHTPDETAEALSVLESAAVKGDGKAAFLLFKIYQEGTGVEKNTVKAEEWLARAPISVHREVAHDHQILSMNRTFRDLASQVRRDNRQT